MAICTFLSFTYKEVSYPNYSIVYLDKTVTLSLPDDYTMGEKFINLFCGLQFIVWRGLIICGYINPFGGWGGGPSPLYSFSTSIIIYGAYKKLWEIFF